MFWSFVFIVIALILRVGVDGLSKNYSFLVSWVPYFNWLFIGTIVLFLIFALVEVLKHFNKK